MGYIKTENPRNFNHPKLYLFITADAGMGKGALTLCREFASPINAELRAIAKQQDADTENKKDNPMLALIISANSSASVFIKTLADNEQDRSDVRGGR